MTQLSEKIFLPFSDKMIPVEKLMGIQLYTSNKLKLNYIDSIKKSKYGNSIGESIEKLVMEDRIVPCVINKRLISYIIYKAFSKKITKNIEGFFSAEFKKVFILIDSNINILTYGNNDSIARITVHELMHLIEHKNPDEFIRTFKTRLENFYYYYYGGLFKVSKKEHPNSKKLLKMLTYFSRTGIDISKIKEYQNIIHDTYAIHANMKDIDAEEILKKLTNAFYLGIVNPNSLYNRYNSFVDVLYNPLMRAYKKTVGISPKNKMLYQEIFSASEVISTISEIKITSLILNSINAIK